jgi:hypothetical protein
MLELFTITSALFFLMVTALLGPGLLLTKRVGLLPLERVTAAVGFSGVYLYLAGFAIYAFDLPLSSHWAVMLTSLIALVLSTTDLKRLAADKTLRLPFFAVVFMFFWIALHVAIMRNFSGGGWYSDWFEHYQRMLFFLLRPPLDSLLAGRYWLPARPPLVNVLNGNFLSLISPAYPLYQVTNALLGVTLCLPLLLFATLSKVSSRRIVPILIVLIAFNPMFLQNATHPWTRPMTNFYILGGLYFYWRGYSENIMTKIGVAMIFFAAAILAHYSALPYLICVVGHFLMRVGIRRFFYERSLILSAVVAILLLATWFGWSIAHYGWAITGASNTTVQTAQNLDWRGLTAQFATNLWNTLIPHWFRNVSTELLQQGFFLGYLRDSIFFAVQSNLLVAVGLTGGMLLIFQIVSEARNGGLRKADWHDWFLLTIAMIILSVAVNPEGDEFGVAHVCLQPVVFLGLVYLSIANCQRGVVFQILLGVGCLMGYAMGILLHFGFQALTFANDKSWWNFVSIGTRENWQIKETFKIAFFGDLVADYQKLFFLVEVLTAVSLCALFVACCGIEETAKIKPAQVVKRRNPR